MQKKIISVYPIYSDSGFNKTNVLNPILNSSKSFSTLNRNPQYCCRHHLWWTENIIFFFLIEKKQYSVVDHDVAMPHGGLKTNSLDCSIYSAGLLPSSLPQSRFHSYFTEIPTWWNELEALPKLNSIYLQIKNMVDKSRAWIWKNAFEIRPIISLKIFIMLN